MAYSKVDNVEYAIDWIDTTAGNTLDITKYIISHTSEEGLTVDNNKISLAMKLIKDYTLSDGTPCPFFSNTQGKSRLKTDGLLNVYVRYTNGDAELKSMSNLLKTYYITNWKVTEPDNKLTLDAVDLSYKITNRNLSKVYSYLYYETSGFTATGTTFTDSTKTFDIPATNAYQLGLKYMTLELIDTAGNIYNYLITNNTATTCTTHKTIASPVGAWSSYRIGWNSPLAIYDAIKRTVMPSNGQGEIYTKLETNLTTNVGASYINGIQVLRKDGATTWAFPIVNIGEPYIPVYKLINELSAYTACNTVEELEGTLMIKRDMTFAVNYNNSTGYTTANWFYADLPEVSSTTYTVSSVSDYDVVCDTSSANDLGKLARVKYTRGTIDYYKTYTIMAVNTGTNTYTLSSNAEEDGITTNDTMKVIGSVDFVWDNDDDYKHIYSIDLGSKDEEKFNTVFYNAGRNEVAGRDVVGMYFYDETQSDSLKTTFVAMTTVAKNMMLWCTTGADGAINGKVIKKEGDDWLGWDAGASAFTSTSTDWDFQTTFGTSTTYTITSRASFNSAFTTCAKIIAKNKSRAIVVNQKENTLTGTITTRGQKFVKIDDAGSSTTKWYEKGTRILFSKPDSGLANDGGKYYLLVVKKISHSITDGAWRTTMDVEYDNFNDNELINVKW